MDESYNKTYFCLGALLVDASAAAEIDEGLSELVKTIADRHNSSSLCRDTELHGYPLFHGKDEWEVLNVRERIDVYAKAMKIVAAAGGEFILRGMNVKRQKERYPTPFPAHEVVLPHLLETIDEVVRARSKKVLVLADEIHTHERHRTNFRDYRRYGTPGYTPSNLESILDTIHFAPSHHSRLLQAADLFTFLYRRYAFHPEPNERARKATESIWEVVNPILIRRWVWTP